MKLRIGVVIFTFLAIPAIFLGLTAAFYVLAAALENVFSGGAAVANTLTLLLVTVMVFATVLTLAERKWSAMMQDR
ncbi:MAG: NADH-quinone oxidoreductase subunit H, partial [Myxococcales bacterium]